MYYINGDTMKIYIELIILINFLLDFNILYIVNKILKRNSNIKKIILLALFGNITLIFLFINISSLLLFLIKILLAIIMSVITYNYKNIKYTLNNVTYIYMVSTIFGGILYFLKDNLNNNLFYVILVLLLTPILSLEIIKHFNKIKSNYKYYYQIKINFNDNKNIELNSFLDTGNKLIDPYTNKGIILVDINKIKKLVKIRSPIYVPFKSLNNTGLIKCIKPVSIEINGLVLKNYLIGLSEESFNIDGIDCLLNYKLLEDLNV